MTSRGPVSPQFLVQSSLTMWPKQVAPLDRGLPIVKMGT